MIYSNLHFPHAALISRTSHALQCPFLLFHIGPLMYSSSKRYTGGLSLDGEKTSNGLIIFRSPRHMRLFTNLITSLN